MKMMWKMALWEKKMDKALRTSRSIKIPNQAFLSGMAYCISSCSMILINKIFLSSYDFNAGISLMLYQNFISVLIVSTLSVLGVVATEPLSWKLTMVWIPVNIIFVGMLITSMFSLKYINVAMVTVLKKVTNVMTAVVDIALSHGHCKASDSIRKPERVYKIILSLPLGILLIFVFKEVDYLVETLVGSPNKILYRLLAYYCSMFLPACRIWSFSWGVFCPSKAQGKTSIRMVGITSRNSTTV